MKIRGLSEAQVKALDVVRHGPIEGIADRELARQLRLWSTSSRGFRPRVVLDALERRKLMACDFLNRWTLTDAGRDAIKRATP